MIAGTAAAAVVLSESMLLRPWPTPTLQVHDGGVRYVRTENMQWRCAYGLLHYLHGSFRGSLHGSNVSGGSLHGRYGKYERFHGSNFHGSFHESFHESFHGSNFHEIFHGSFHGSFDGSNGSCRESYGSFYGSNFHGRFRGKIWKK